MVTDKGVTGLGLTKWLERAPKERDIKTSGGITTCASGGEGFESLCYSDKGDVENLRHAVELCAQTFDEFIFDDFYFTNCRCKKCIKEKAERSWSEFRMAQKLEITKNVIMKTAKRINPNVNVIIKYPQWFIFWNNFGFFVDLYPHFTPCLLY